MVDELMDKWIVAGFKDHIKFLSLSSPAPSDVASVSVTDRKETEMTLKWDKVNNNYTYTYELEYNGERHQTDLVEYTVKDLSSGTQYFFTLYTVFQNVRSNGYNFTNVTGKPQNIISLTRAVLV